MHETIDRMHAERWRASISSLDSLIGNLLQSFTCLGIAATITEANIGDFFGTGAMALVGCSGCYYLTLLVARKSAQREISE